MSGGNDDIILNVKNELENTGIICNHKPKKMFYSLLQNYHNISNLPSHNKKKKKKRTNKKNKTNNSTVSDNKDNNDDDVMSDIYSGTDTDEENLISMLESMF